jgi:hypothetical protein
MAVRASDRFDADSHRWKAFLRPCFPSGAKDHNPYRKPDQKPHAHILSFIAALYRQAMDPVKL